MADVAYRPSVIHKNGRLGWALLMVCCSSVSALAQTGSSGPPKWEVEAHAGGALSSHPTGGASDLPGPGATFTLGPLFNLSTRLVPSWYFGDGARLFNQNNNNTQFRLSAASLAPLDRMLTRASAVGKQGLSFGLRLRRPLTRRLGIEVGLAVAGFGQRLSDEALDDIEATRASFQAVWSGLVPQQPTFQNLSASSIVAVSAGSARQVFTTGAVDFNLVSTPKTTIYALGGAGIVTNVGELPRVVITGHYQFLLFGVTPINDTDRVTLRLAADANAFVTVLGVGGKRLLSPRWGVRSDLRVHLNANSVRLLLDAAPERVLVPGGGFVLLSPGDPGLIFNGLDGEPKSTFSGPAVKDFVTFDGSGMQRHVSVTAGLFVRF